MLQSRKLEYKREQLEQEIQDLQEAFDSALVVLRKEKLNLEAHVKAAQIKRLTYQQELQLLKVPFLAAVPDNAYTSCLWDIVLLMI